MRIISTATVCTIILGACAAVGAIFGLIGSTAHAQTGWGATAPNAEPEAKKPPPKPPLQIAGSWNGTVVDPVQGTGAINLTFTEKTGKAKATLTGTWTVNYNNPPNGAINDVGTLKGSVVGNAVAVTLHPRKGDALGSCSLVFNSVEATQDNITGTYRFGGCPANHTGPITVQPGPPPTTVFVNIGDDFFFPTKVTVNRGQTVRWTNNGGEDHSVNANPGTGKCKPISSDTFDSPSIDVGQTFERTFNNPGTFAYHCEIHGCPMKGTITVN
jgi:plastocyanin